MNDETKTPAEPDEITESDLDSVTGGRALPLLPSTRSSPVATDPGGIYSTDPGGIYSTDPGGIYSIPRHTPRHS
jgi:hypothetical protein